MSSLATLCVQGQPGLEENGEEMLLIAVNKSAEVS